MRLLVLSLCLFSGATSASVLWKGDYESGDLTQWTKIDGLLGRLTVVADPVRQGRYALRTELRSGDVSSNGTRNELVLSSVQEVEGDDKWYAWSTLFPADYPSNDTWQVFTQWHHSGCCGSPPVEFNVLGERIQLAHKGSTVLWSTPLVRGAWHDFVVHVHWSSTNGFIDLYYDGQKVLDHQVVPTLNPGESAYLKQGLYRNANITQVGVVFHDGMVMGTSLADVAPQLVVAPPPPVPAPDAGTPDPIDPGPAPDAGVTPQPGPVPPSDPVPPAEGVADAGIPLQTGTIGYRLPGGGCSHTARDSLTLLGVLGVALLCFRRRR